MSLDTILNFTSYEEIANRPLFKTEIDTTKSEIDKLIATSNFTEMHPCGKKDCHQPHYHGWLALTKDNQETLIGNVCGIEWGGEAFKLQKRNLQKLIKRDSLLKNFYSILAESENLLDKVANIKMRTKGANWLDRVIKKFEDNCSHELLNIIKSRAAKGQTSISIDILKTEEERDLDLISQDRSRASVYKTKFIGDIVGLELFTFDLREILMVKIYNKVRQIQKTDPSLLSTPALNSLLRDAGEFDNLFIKCEEILKHGNKFFFTPNNFTLLKTLDKNRKHNHLTQINWNLPD